MISFHQGNACKLNRGRPAHHFELLMMYKTTSQCESTQTNTLIQKPASGYPCRSKCTSEGLTVMTENLFTVRRGETKACGQDGTRRGRVQRDEGEQTEDRCWGQACSGNFGEVEGCKSVRSASLTHERRQQRQLKKGGDRRGVSHLESGVRDTADVSALIYRIQLER